VDGLELWRGMDDATLDDADYFSTQGDATGVSIYSYITGASASYVTRAQIHGALSTLGFTGGVGDVDVDALMVKDTNGAGDWDEGDEILFSIRSAAGWTGGEIVHWRFGSAAGYLFHGGHDWDSSFDLSTAFPVGVGDQEVDAIEATSVPEPAELLLLACGALLLQGLDRRRRAGRG
ncbi:MAG: hypothetical protein JRH19_17870, partial [Deltaproteobacteria bacterium]|nr:hypothetical protein [Deltaproteobacteria bacterium]